MRKKIIRAFLGVYLAVCVCYSVVRGIPAPAMAEDAEVLSEPVPQTTSEVIPTPEPELEILPEPTETPVPESPVTSASGEASYSGRSHGKHGGRGRDDTAEYTFTAPAAETSAPAITSDPAPEEEPDSEEHSLYTIAVHSLTLHYYDHRDSTGTEAPIPLGLRPIINQLKHSGDWPL